MIVFPATSFGYGLRIGVTLVTNNRRGCAKWSPTQHSALTVLWLPDCDFLNSLADIAGIAFIVLPPCSPYSHFAAALWSCTVPALTIEDPRRIPNNATLLADFDGGRLLLAESDDEAETLRMQTGRECTTKQIQSSQSKEHGRELPEIAVLAEAYSADQITRALTDGADGLGILKAEDLFEKLYANPTEVEALIHTVKIHPQTLPLCVRFFDQERGRQDNSRLHYPPHSYLGYRGVRILELDDSWLARFAAGLEKLDLEQIVVVLPMVTSPVEVIRVREQLGSRWNKVGVTVETPAAAISIAKFLDVVDFVEIGLNDLTQYTMAWDRDSPNQERLPRDCIVAPVAALVASVARSCAEANVPYTVGIDLRPSAVLAAQLRLLGVASISCAPSLIRPWKHSFLRDL